jgi:hypothetical protein
MTHVTSMLPNHRPDGGEWRAWHHGVSRRARSAEETTAMPIPTGIFDYVIMVDVCRSTVRGGQI